MSGHIRSPIEGALVCAVLAVWSLWSGRAPRPGGFVSRDDSPLWYWVLVAIFVVSALVFLLFLSV
jgi:hypothetical protein